MYLVIYKITDTKMEVKKVRLSLLISYFPLIPQWCQTLISSRGVRHPTLETSGLTAGVSVHPHVESTGPST